MSELLHWFDLATWRQQNKLENNTADNLLCHFIKRICLFDERRICRFFKHYFFSHFQSPVIFQCVCRWTFISICSQMQIYDSRICLFPDSHVADWTAEEVLTWVSIICFLHINWLHCWPPETKSLSDVSWCFTSSKCCHECSLHDRNW